MEYVYTAMLLHSAGTEVSAKSVEKVLKAAGVKADKSRAEALVASLEGVDIEEAMATAAVAAPAVVVAFAAIVGQWALMARTAPQSPAATDTSTLYTTVTSIVMMMAMIMVLPMVL